MPYQPYQRLIKASPTVRLINSSQSPYQGLTNALPTPYQLLTTTLPRPSILTLYQRLPNALLPCGRVNAEHGDPPSRHLQHFPLSRCTTPSQPHTNALLPCGRVDAEHGDPPSRHLQHFPQPSCIRGRPRIERWLRRLSFAPRAAAATSVP